MYTQESEHEGSPVYKNSEGMYCYYYKKTAKWYLNSKFTPDRRACFSWTQAEAGGGLPEGARTWKCWVGRWVERTLTVTPLVRLNPAHLVRTSPTL